MNLKDIDTEKFLTAVRERLKNTDATFAEQHAARAALQDIFLNLDGCICTKTAADLAALQGIGSSEMAKTLALLEEIWAIRRVKSGRIKIIELPVGERLEDFFNRLAAKHG